MKKFMVIYYLNGKTWTEQAQAGEVKPEEMQESMRAWMAWGKKCGDALLDFGAPLGDYQKLGGAGQTAGGEGDDDTQRPAGFSILQAPDLQSAVKLLEDHPHLSWRDGGIGCYEMTNP